MKLDYDVLSTAITFTDAVKERCLDLRSLKVAKLENLAMTKDLHDTIDLTDNDLQSLSPSDFPPFTRLKTLLLSQNRITHIEPKTASKIPHIESLILANNSLAELGDIAVLSEFKDLVRVALVGNPVCTKQNYRLWVIFCCPKLRVLDFRRVKDVERAEAKRVFSGSKEAKEYAKQVGSTVSGGGTTGTFVVGEGAPVAVKQVVKPHTGPSPEEAARIKAAIESAGSLEEVARLKRQLEGGSVPSSKKR
ncbi:U2 snRNP complex subunit [Rhizoclosmatium sp. JEL0117]|nr:U2 snRNP complex subunit [Rhizoclosmatium sp. JEL0117]